MGLAALRAPVDSWGPRPPQKFGHGFLFAGLFEICMSIYLGMFL